MRNVYMSVVVTYFEENPQLNSGDLYVAIDSCQLEIHDTISVKDAEKELEKLEKKLNRKATFRINPVSPTITYRELHGYIE